MNSSGDPTLLKLLRAFAIARRVNEIYWQHAGDGADNRVSIENLHEIVSKIAKLPIEQFEVDGEFEHIRGRCERYKDKIVIHIGASQDEYWKRFTATKEYCHAILDKMDDYSTDVVQTLSHLRESKSLKQKFFDGQASAATSEQIAEMIAVELIYPYEYRDHDFKERQDGESISSIAERRGVPAYYIEVALDEGYLNSCKALWDVLKHFPGN